MQIGKFLLFVMLTSFLIITLGTYLLIIFIHRKEIIVIHRILAPVIEVKEKKDEEEKQKWKALSFEQKREIRLQKLKEGYELARLKKQQKIKGKFDKLLKKEQFGTKGFKKATQQDKKQAKKEN